MSIKLNQDVLTYKIHMSDKYLYCNRFENKKVDYLIARFANDDEYNFYFESEVTQSFKCNYTNTILESRKLYSKYVLVKNEQNKDLKLSANVVYKITYNKIDKLS